MLTRIARRACSAFIWRFPFLSAPQGVVKKPRLRRSVGCIGGVVKMGLGMLNKPFRG